MRALTEIRCDVRTGVFDSIDCSTSHHLQYRRYHHICLNHRQSIARAYHKLFPADHLRIQRYTLFELFPSPLEIDQSFPPPTGPSA